MEYQKIVIRKSPVIPYCGSMVEWEERQTEQAFPAKEENLEFLISSVFRETLSLGKLQEEYRSFLRTGKSQYFAWCYRLSSETGVVIDHHITLYHIIPDDVFWQKEFLDWYYPRGSKYLADTWWFDDEEVLQDLIHLSPLSFFEKYK